MQLTQNFGFSSPNLEFSLLKTWIWGPFLEHQCLLLASPPNSSQMPQTSLFTLNFHTPSKLLRKQPPKPSFLLKFYLLKSPLMWLMAKTKFGLSVRLIANQGPLFWLFFSPLAASSARVVSAPFIFKPHYLLAKRKLNLSQPRFKPTPCQS